MHSGTVLPIQFPAALPIEVLTARVDHLEAVVSNTARLHRKEVAQRYGGIALKTVHRWVAKGKLPPPIRICGPVWKLADLEAYELAGRLPAPSSAATASAFPPSLSTNGQPVRLSTCPSLALPAPNVSGPNGIKRPGLL